MGRWTAGATSAVAVVEVEVEVVGNGEWEVGRREESDDGMGSARGF